MTRFLLDTNMAGHYINRRHGVFDRARIEVANGNPLAIGVPDLDLFRLSMGQPETGFSHPLASVSE